MAAYRLKVTTSDGCPIYGRGQYDFSGKWKMIYGDVMMCYNGFHVAKPRHISIWLGYKFLNRKLYLVQVKGQKEFSFNKSAHKYMRFVKELKIPYYIKRRKTRQNRYTEKDIMEILVINGVKITRLNKELRPIYKELVKKYEV